MQEITSFLTVLAVDVCVAGSICVLYATGIRMWARGAVDSEGNAHLGSRIVSACCFAVCVAIVIFALYMIIPVFH